MRIPAALCGLVGFKPTMRRVPVQGAMPLAPSLDSIGPIAHTVDDCIFLDNVIADEALVIPEIALAGLKFAVPEDVVLDDIDAQVAKAFTATLSRLSAAGVQLTEIPMKMLTEARELYLISPYEAYRWHKDLLARRAGDYDPRVLARIQLGANATDADRKKITEARADWRSRVEQAITGFDALVMPTVPISGVVKTAVGMSL